MADQSLIGNQLNVDPDAITSGGAIGSSGLTRGTQAQVDMSPKVADSFGNTPWAILTPSKIPKPPNATAQPDDPFWNFAALNVNDFRSPYGYELVIADGDTPLYNIILPIAPQKISMSTPPAINTTVTMKGIIEEHNGAPLRNISFAGTMGVMPVDLMQQGQAGASSAISSYLQTIFKNTIQSVNNVAAQVQNVTNAFTGGGKNIASKLSYSDAQIAPGPGQSNYSGYYYIHNLLRFLDFYVASKKQKACKNWRLVFQMHKDQMYYDCTLGPYNFDKDAGTVEYTYSVQLVAWRRRAAPVGNSRAKLANNGDRTPSQQNQLNKLQQIFNTLQQTRQLLFASYNVLAGINADINNSFVQPLNDVNMIIKDTLNLGLTMADFITGNKGNAFFPGAYAVLTSGASDLPPSFSDQVAQAGFTGTAGAGGGSAYINAQISQASSTVAGTSQPTTNNTNPLQTMLNSPMQYAAIFDQVPIDALPMTAAGQAYVDNVLDRVRSLTQTDFENYRDSMSQVQATVSSVLGGANATYNRVFGLPPPVNVYRQLSTDDIMLLSQLNDCCRFTDTIITTIKNITSQTSTDYYSFYRDYAVNGGLAFNDNVSKFFVPFPLGGSMESLAVQYLGDANRWIEIVAINGLKEPYIDEDGFFYSLTGNGSGQYVTIGQSNNLFVGQIINLSSQLQQSAQYKILSIDIVSPTQIVLQLSGPNDTSIYRIEDGAQIQAYMPDTVNSNMLIAIPSDAPVSTAGAAKPLPGYSDLNGLAKIAQVDFLLNSSGDLVLSSSGDVSLAIGLANLIQVAKMILLTPIGSIATDPTFGNTVSAGLSTADLTATDIMTQLDAMFAQDPRYAGVLAANVIVNGPAVSITVVAKIANTNLILPLTTELPP